MKLNSKPLAILVTFLAIMVIPKLSGQLANLSETLFGNLDPDGTYLWISVHHIFQLLLTIMVMLLFRRNLGFWGFNLDNLKTSLRYLKYFVIYSTGFIFIMNIFLYFTLPAPVFEYSLNTENILGQLAFQLFLSGTCEEPLFRGFVMVMLYGAFAGTTRVLKIDFPHAGLIATIYFVLAHIQYSIWPFEITYLHPMQLLLSFGLGLYYAVVFYRTRSLLTPIITHGYINFILTGFTLLRASLGS